MRKVNISDVEEQERQSPKGKFGRRSKNISVALGRDPASLDLGKRHPFDLALVSIPKGKSLCPYHSHSSESELYLVVSGKGSIRDKDGSTIVGPGDAFSFGPGEAHQLSNAGDEDFVYYVIADNPRGDSCHYPDSGKFAVWKEGMEEVIVKGKETDYFEGEERVIGRGGSPNRPRTIEVNRPCLDEVKKVNLNQIKEEPWQSPGGKYAAHFKGISIALGRDPDSLDLAKRHPFDLEWTRVPPGKSNFPYHAHSAAWEMYLIISGNGTVRDKNRKTEVVEGDAFIFGPDEPHQITNSGDVDLIYYVIADNPIGESAYYPDSGKWKVNKTSAADRVVIKGKETDYFDGEE